MPILGTVASSFKGDVGDFYSLATITLTATSTSITFTSIPSTYKHLQVRCLTRGDRAVTFDNIDFQYNNDTGANYTRTAWTLKNDSSFSQTTAVSQTFAPSPDTTQQNITASAFGAFILDIQNYTSATKKIVRCFSGAPNLGGQYVQLTAGWYDSTAAISSITVKSNVTYHMPNSTFALYGIA